MESKNIEGAAQDLLNRIENSIHTTLEEFVTEGVLPHETKEMIFKAVIEKIYNNI